MLHQLDSETLGAHGEAMAGAVTACVHCGFCLPTCPTYRELGQEMDSPRGRIVLMKEVLEGQLAMDAALPHVDKCLGCLACEPACPSGVSYRDLISPFRARAESQRRRSWWQKFRRRVIGATIPHPQRFRIAARLGRWVKPFAALAPKSLRPMLEMLPARLPDAETLAGRFPSHSSPTRTRVALLTGCAQQVLAPEINRDVIEVLNHNGVDVVVPPDQGCCGALAWHVGDLGQAQDFARANLAAFGKELESVDAIVTTAAGCGSGMQEYGLILAGEGEGEEKAAQALVRKTVDISVFLHRLGLDPEPPALSGVRGAVTRIAYHDACHLANAQGVRDEPRELLRSIANVELVEVADPQICCGSAGTYNLDQPGIAASLGESKANAILATGADFVASGNIGCLTQLNHHLRRLAKGRPPEILHTVSVLARAYRSAEEA